MMEIWGPGIWTELQTGVRAATPVRKRSAGQGPGERVCCWVRTSEGKEAQEEPGEGYSEREEGKSM